LKHLRGNTAYTICVWAVSEAGPGANAEIMGLTSAVPPGVCGTPHAADGNGHSGKAVPHVAWSPPRDSGGAAVVAYRVWLRPLFRDSFGDVFPADGWIDLGLFEHRGQPADMQLAPLMLDALPRCTGCLCSVAALNGAGHLGPSTPEAPVLMRGPDSPRAAAIHELPQSGQNSAVVSPVPTGGFQPSASECAGPGDAHISNPGSAIAIYPESRGDVHFPWEVRQHERPAHSRYGGPDARLEDRHPQVGRAETSRMQSRPNPDLFAAPSLRTAAEKAAASRSSTAPQGTDTAAGRDLYAQALWAMHRPPGASKRL